MLLELVFATLTASVVGVTSVQWGSQTILIPFQYLNPSVRVLLIDVLLLRFPNSSKICIETNLQRAGVGSDRSSRCQGAAGLNLAGSFLKQLVKGTLGESKYVLMWC